MRSSGTSAVLLAAALLCGCAPSARSSMVVEAAKPDCSFRAATTCWTVSGRFPTTRQVRPPQEDEPLKQPATILASGADTVVITE